MLIIGHRGAKGLAPENTIRALKKAMEHHADMVEIDVHVTCDGIPILSHDDKLHDAAGNSVKIKETDYATLLEHKADLTTLRGAITYINRRVPFYIEVKERHATATIIVVVQEFLANGWHPDDFRFASFDFRLLKEVHEALPQVPVVIGERWSGARAVHRAKKLGTRNLSMDQRWMWRGFIAPMAKRGWRLHAYTVNSPKRARKFKRYGLYAIFTDYPDSFDR